MYLYTISKIENQSIILSHINKIENKSIGSSHTFHVRKKFFWQQIHHSLLSKSFSKGNISCSS